MTAFAPEILSAYRTRLKIRYFNQEKENEHRRDRMYNIMERYMVQKLNKSGAPNQAVQKITGVSERTIRRINAEEMLDALDKEKFRKLHPVGRPSKVSEYEVLVKQWLEEPRKPEDGLIKSLEIYTRLVGMGYEGGKTAVYELVRRLRPKENQAAIVRFEGLPGEFSQHDFGQRRVTFADGTTKIIHFFASRLKYSRTIDVQVVENEQQETVVRCLLRAFERFGGVPLKCVFDNCKAVVDRRETRADGFVRVIWTARFAQLAIDCGFIPVACWPYRPREKGSVENLVGFVKGNFFSGRTFGDCQKLKEQSEYLLEISLPHEFTALFSRVTPGRKI